MKNILTLLLILLLFGCDQKAEKAALMTKIETLTAERDSLMHLTNQLQSKLDSLNKEANIWFDNEQEEKELSEMGIKNPREFVIQSLMKQPELIPTAGVLGGQMKFIQVEPLGKQHLLAYYEDGHTSGKAVYSYKLNNGKLDFKLLSSHDD
jgi:outer membrane murein-binding lipoprotein Lpp